MAVPEGQMRHNLYRTLLISATIVAVAFVLLLPSSGLGAGEELFQAIRDGNIAVVKAHLSKNELEARDVRGATPLMYAAAFGNFETFKLILDAGSDVNAHNNHNATALLWAARDTERAKLLIERGADVNAASTEGQTPLIAASSQRDGSPVVALLVAKGANLDFQDGRRGSTALNIAAESGATESVRILLAKGANPAIPNRFGVTPLGSAPSGRRIEIAQLMLQKGLDVNLGTTDSGRQTNGPTDRLKVTALHNAAAFGPVDMVRSLLNAGARVDARDSRNLTPLFFALATEYPSIEMVQTLLRAGADVNARDKTGETPLDWAEKFGDPQVIGVLKNSGAKKGIIYEAPILPSIERPKPAVALARSMTLLESSSAEFFKKSLCVSCHHQPLIARTQAMARLVGIPVNEKAAKEQLSQMVTQWVGPQEEFLQGIFPAGGPNRLAEILLGLSASSHPADSITDSAIVAMALSQRSDGRWAAGEVQLRPPITESDIAATARILRALQEYFIPAFKPELAKRAARAQAWLKSVKILRSEDAYMRLSGLKWSGASAAELRSAAKAVIALQRPDGGWGDNPNMPSDAYETGGALVALAESKAIEVSDGAYQRGIQYLLSTQFPDGSWHVRSRAIKFQPYFESGFPFGHDQWISAAATSWAAQAIALSLQPAATK
jgi:ankyrin repeat protein